MKITIEPTTEQELAHKRTSADCLHSKVTIEHPYDDLGIHDTMDMVRKALIAYGWNPKVIDQYIKEP